MIEEIQAAVNFLTKLIAKSDALDETKIQQLNIKFCHLLEERFHDHWFPEDANRGQAYRCIRINELDRRDPSLEQACKELSIRYEDLKLPIELTIWVDPGEVACRFGEHKGSYCVVAKFHDGNLNNFIDQINVEELEQKSLRAKQSTFDPMRKKQRMMGRQKNGYNGLSYLNGFSNDYNSVIATTTSPYYGYYSPPYSSFANSPPNPAMFSQPKYPMSPPQSRSMNGTPQYRVKTNQMASYANGNLMTNGTSKFQRNLNSSFGSSGFGTMYDSRYHYINKSTINGVKA